MALWIFILKVSNQLELFRQAQYGPALGYYALVIDCWQNSLKSIVIANLPIYFKTFTILLM